MSTVHLESVTKQRKRLSFVISNWYQGLYRRSPVIAERWRLGSKVGSGSYGQVFRATEAKRLVQTQAFAVKMEQRSELCIQSRLEKEYKIYKLLYEGTETVVGLTCPHFYGQWTDKNILVMDLHGPSLHNILRREGAFPMKELLAIGKQVLMQIQCIHSKGFIHRDLNPKNMVTGLKDSKTVYIIDFGFAKRFRHGNERKHIRYKTGQRFIGTPIFSSARTDLGIEQSRRDDLESIGYSLVYLNKFSLPWTQVNAMGNAEHGVKLRRSKQRTTLTELCRGMPHEIREYFDYVLRLGFEEEPNYQMLIDLLSKASDKL